MHAAMCNDPDVQPGLSAQSLALASRVVCESNIRSVACHAQPVAGGVRVRANHLKGPHRYLAYFVHFWPILACFCSISNDYGQKPSISGPRPFYETQGLTFISIARRRPRHMARGVGSFSGITKFVQNNRLCVRTLSGTDRWIFDTEIQRPRSRRTDEQPTANKERPTTK